MSENDSTYFALCSVFSTLESFNVKLRGMEANKIGSRYSFTMTTSAVGNSGRQMCSCSSRSINRRDDTISSLLESGVEKKIHENIRFRQSLGSILSLSRGMIQEVECNKREKKEVGSGEEEGRMEEAECMIEYVFYSEIVAAYPLMVAFFREQTKSVSYGSLLLSIPILTIVSPSSIALLNLSIASYVTE